MIKRRNSYVGAAGPRSAAAGGASAANAPARGTYSSRLKPLPQGISIFLVVVIGALLVACAPVPSGNVYVTAVLSQELDLAAATDEADVIIYLRDLAPVDGVRPGAWNAPVVDHHRVALNTLSSRDSGRVVYPRPALSGELS